MTEVGVQKKTTAARYKRLSGKREKYLQTGDECASYTLPRFHSKFGTNSKRKIETPMQSVGAYGVNNITSKLLLTLFPSNTLFFQKKADSVVLNEADQEGAKTDIEKALQDRDISLLEHMESMGDRPKLYQLLIRSIITGNVLFYVPPEGSIKLYPLQNYVVCRDGSGNVLEIIVKESVSPLMLDPEEIGEELHKELLKKYKSDGKDIDLYTHIKRETDHFTTHQEINETMLDNTEGTYPLDDNPWVPLALLMIDGEDYGRSLVEEYLGDLKSLEVLTRAITGVAAGAARLLVFVSPEGITNIDDVTDCPNGGVVQGRAEDVTVLQMDKRGDLQIAQALMESLEERLKNAFLLNRSVQRQAERVTAEEIRYVAEELEQGLGGLYSMLSSTLQLPYVRAREWRLIKQGKLGPLPKEIVKPTIITGFDALGRGNDKAKLLGFANALVQLVGPEITMRMINGHELATRLAHADGIELTGLLKSEEEMAAEVQEQQQAALLPELLKQGGGLMKEAVKNQQPNQ